MSQSLFPRPLPFAAIGSSGAARHEAASPDERSAIANALGIVELRLLEADVAFDRKSEVVTVSGRIKAEPVQSCVVTLAPVVQHIDERFSRSVTRAPMHGNAAEVVVSPVDSEDDPPDIVIGDRLDVGEILIEELALLIDPYPRAPGVEFTSPSDEDDTAQDSPFAILKTLGRGESS